MWFWVMGFCGFRVMWFYGYVVLVFWRFAVLFSSGCVFAALTSLLLLQPYVAIVVLPLGFPFYNLMTLQPYNLTTL